MLVLLRATRGMHSPHAFGEWSTYRLAVDLDDRLAEKELAWGRKRSGSSTHTFR